MIWKPFSLPFLDDYFSQRFCCHNLILILQNLLRENQDFSLFFKVYVIKTLPNTIFLAVKMFISFAKRCHSHN